MTHSSPDNLVYRLQSAANYSRRNDDRQCAIIRFRLFITTGGELTGWTKPEIILIEPRIFSHSCLELYELNDWADVVDYLIKSNTLNFVEVLIRNGKPVGVIRSASF